MANPEPYVLKEPLPLFKKVGQEILRLRKEAGLTQIGLAQKIGVTQQEISRVENGDNCSLSTLHRIAKALDHDIEIVFKEKEHEKI